MQLLDIGLVESELGNSLSHLRIHEHAHLVPVRDQRLDLFEFRKLCSRHLVDEISFHRWSLDWTVWAPRASGLHERTLPRTICQTKLHPIPELATIRLRLAPLDLAAKPQCTN